MIQESNTYYFRGYCLSHNTFSRVQTQSYNNEDFSRFEKPKPKDPKPAPSYDNVTVEPAKKEDQKNKKKKF